MKNNSKYIGEPKPAKKIKSKNRLEIKKKKNRFNAHFSGT